MWDDKQYSFEKTKKPPRSRMRVVALVSSLTARHRRDPGPHEVLDAFCGEGGSRDVGQKGLRAALALGLLEQDYKAGPYRLTQAGKRELRAWRMREKGASGEAVEG